MNRLIIVGSPRPNGRSAALADLLFEACIAECPDDEVALAPVSTLSIAPCEGCDACRELEERRGRTIEGAPAGDGADDCDPIRCIIDDDMAEIYPLIDAADELIVVSPVYFAGAPAQLKALLDRLQPYFWTDARRLSKRPAILHVVGEGGDPHGFDPLWAWCAQHCRAQASGWNACLTGLAESMRTARSRPTPSSIRFPRCLGILHRRHPDLPTMLRAPCRRLNAR